MFPHNIFQHYIDFFSQTLSHIAHAMSLMFLHCWISILLPPTYLIHNMSTISKHSQHVGKKPNISHFHIENLIRPITLVKHYFNKDNPSSKKTNWTKWVMDTINNNTPLGFRLPNYPNTFHA